MTKIELAVAQYGVNAAEPFGGLRPCQEGRDHADGLGATEAQPSSRVAGCVLQLRHRVEHTPPRVGVHSRIAVQDTRSRGLADPGMRGHVLERVPRQGASSVEPVPWDRLHESTGTCQGRAALQAERRYLDPGAGRMPICCQRLSRSGMNQDSTIRPSTTRSMRISSNATGRPVGGVVPAGSDSGPLKVPLAVQRLDTRSSSASCSCSVTVRSGSPSAGLPPGA